MLRGGGAKSPAKKSSVQENLFRLQAGDFRTSVLGESLELRGSINVAVVGAHIRRAIHGFHGGVREEGNFVSGFDFFSGAGQGSVCIAIFTRDGAGLFRSG